MAAASLCDVQLTLHHRVYCIQALVSKYVCIVYMGLVTTCRQQPLGLSSVGDDSSEQKLW